MARQSYSYMRSLLISDRHRYVEKMKEMNEDNTTEIISS